MIKKEYLKIEVHFIPKPHGYGLLGHYKWILLHVNYDSLGSKIMEQSKPKYSSSGEAMLGCVEYIKNQKLDLQMLDIGKCEPNI